MFKSNSERKKKLCAAVALFPVIISFYTDLTAYDTISEICDTIFERTRDADDADGTD